MGRRDRYGSEGGEGDPLQYNTLSLSFEARKKKGGKIDGGGGGVVRDL